MTEEPGVDVAPSDALASIWTRRPYLLPTLIVVVLAASGVIWWFATHVPPFFLFPLVLFFMIRWRRGQGRM